MIKTVVVTIHGQESIGKKMADLNYQLSQEDFMVDCTFINLRYTKLWTIVNVLPWARSMVAKYVAARLNAIGLQYPGARIIVIAHSNGTRATRIAMDMRLKSKKNWPKFRIDELLLLGCPIKRNYRWSRHPLTTVYNFVSSNDMVVFFAKFYGMGSAGRGKGFKHKAENLNQYYVKWGHGGFMDFFYVIVNVVRGIMEKR